MIRRVSRCRDFVSVSHSQIIITRQPNPRKTRFCFSSRLTLAASFPRQNSTLDFGWRFPALHLCWCQKHPCTNMMHLRLGKTMSGRPGKPRTCNRYR